MSESHRCERDGRAEGGRAPDVPSTRRDLTPVIAAQPPRRAVEAAQTARVCAVKGRVSMRDAQCSIAIGSARPCPGLDARAERQDTLERLPIEGGIEASRRPQPL